MTEAPTPETGELLAAARKIDLWIKCGMPDQSDNTPTREALKRDLRKVLAALAAAPRPAEPVAVTIFCPECALPHVDEGEWATTRHHKTHQCQCCGHEWRPFPFATVGVAHPASPAQPEVANVMVWLCGDTSLPGSYTVRTERDRDDAIARGLPVLALVPAGAQPEVAPTDRIDPVIRAAMERSHQSLHTTVLLEAAAALVDACMAVDAAGELPDEIDGSLMDAVNVAIRTIRPDRKVREPRPVQPDLLRQVAPTDRAESLTRDQVHDAILTRMFGPCDVISDELDAKVFDAADAIVAMLTAPTDSGGWRPTHRHVKRGTLYQVVGLGILQAEGPWDHASVAIYTDEEGTTWVRPCTEFQDGRFVKLANERALPTDRGTGE